MKALYLMAILLCSGCALHTMDPAITVTLDDLCTRPSEFNGKLVRFRGTWVQDFESSYLDGCDVYVDTESGALRQDMHFRDLEQQQRASAVEQVDRFERQRLPANWTFRCDIDAEGVFEIAKDPTTSAQKKAGLQVRGYGFGHFGAYRTRIRILKFWSFTSLRTRPNQALEPTSTTVTNPAEPGFAPAVLVAHL